MIYHIPDFPSAESPSLVSMFPISSSIFVFSISSRSIIHAVASLSLITAPVVVWEQPDGDGFHEKRVMIHLAWCLYTHTVVAVAPWCHDTYDCLGSSSTNRLMNYPIFAIPFLNCNMFAIPYVILQYLCNPIYL